MVHANVRRLVLASLGDQEPECGICLEKFTHADATVMDCAHVICRRCSERTRDARCPFCRHVSPCLALPAIPAAAAGSIEWYCGILDLVRSERDCLADRLRELGYGREVDGDTDSDLEEPYMESDSDVEVPPQRTPSAQGWWRPNSPIPPSN
jgi:hypothetical protein